MKVIIAITIATLLLCGAAFAQVSNPSGNPPASNPAEPSASPTAATSATTRESGGIEDQVKKVEDEWARAVMNKDRAAFDRIEADNYIFVMPDGSVRNKTQDMDAMAKSSYTAFSLRDMQVRVFGDIAQVLGVAHVAGTEYGQDVSGDYRFTDVFVNKNGKWQAVSTQSTRLQPSNTQTSTPPQR